MSSAFSSPELQIVIGDGGSSSSFIIKISQIIYKNDHSYFLRFGSHLHYSSFEDAYTRMILFWSRNIEGLCSPVPFRS